LAAAGFPDINDAIKFLTTISAHLTIHFVKQNFLMESVSFIKQWVSVLVVVISLAAVNQKVEATQFISNLDEQWSGGGMGEIEGLFREGVPYGSMTSHFTTGAGSFSVNAVTLEFHFTSSYPTTAPQWVNVQLFQTGGVADILLGSFGNPVVNPSPTQWPQSSRPNSYTTFIDFSPIGQINLDSNSQYSLVLSVPANSPVTAALMFAKPGYTSPTDWTMSATTSGNPYITAHGYYLVMAVDATATPEPGVLGLFSLAGLCSLWYRRKAKK
jgi:hypothetical protein